MGCRCRQTNRDWSGTCALHSEFRIEIDLCMNVIDNVVTITAH